MKKKKFILNYPSTVVIIAICIVMFLITIVMDFLLGQNTNWAYILFLAGGESIPSLLDGQLWRLVTAAFLHGDLLHIAFNIYALWFLGRYVEVFFGSKKMFYIFIFSAIGGGILSAVAGSLGILFNFSAGTFALNTVSVGASGGVFGLIGVLLGNKIRKDLYSPEIPVDQNSLIIIVIANFIYGLSVEGIDNFAHLGGLLVGFLFAYLVRPSLNYKSDSKENKRSNIVFYGTVITVVVSFVAHIIYSVLFF